MTNKEAIEFGNMWLEINKDCKDSSTYAFFELAIKALEQTNVLDKVRAEIIHEFNNHKKGMTVYDIAQIIKKYKIESEEEI